MHLGSNSTIASWGYQGTSGNIRGHQGISGDIGISEDIGISGIQAYMSLASLTLWTGWPCMSHVLLLYDCYRIAVAEE